VHLEAILVRIWRPKSSEFRDTLGGCAGGSLEIHLDAVIE